MPRRRYTKYTDDVRQKAFALFCEGKSITEIRDACGIGDNQGIARIRKEDNWEVKKKVLELNASMDTLRSTSVPLLAIPTGGAIPGDEKTTEEQGTTISRSNQYVNESVPSSVLAGYDQLAKRRADVVITARLVADAARTILEDTLKFRSSAEAWAIFKDAIALERQLAGATVEEMFVLRVFEALQDEIEDKKLLSRVSDRLKLLIAEEKSNA